MFTYSGAANLCFWFSGIGSIGRNYRIEHMCQHSGYYLDEDFKQGVYWGYEQLWIHRTSKVLHEYNSFTKFHVKKCPNSPQKKKIHDAFKCELRRPYPCSHKNIRNRNFTNVWEKIWVQKIHSRTLFKPVSTIGIWCSRGLKRILNPPLPRCRDTQELEGHTRLL